jgi:hypothetical protein
MPEFEAAESKARGAARTGQAAGIAGLIFAGLLGISLVLVGGIERPTEGQDLVLWFESEASAVMSIVTLYLVPFAGIAFLWFMAVLRDRAGSRDDRFFDTVLIGSGLLFVAMLFGGAAAYGGALHGAVRGFPVDSDAIAHFQLLGYGFFNVYAARAAGVFVMVGSTLVLRTGFLPRWIGFIGIVTALVLLLGVSFFQLFIYLFPAWVTLMSVAILFALARQGGAETPKKAV